MCSVIDFAGDKNSRLFISESMSVMNAYIVTREKYRQVLFIIRVK